MRKAVVASLVKVLFSAGSSPMPPVALSDGSEISALRLPVSAADSEASFARKLVPRREALEKPLRRMRESTLKPRKVAKKVMVMI